MISLPECIIAEKVYRQIYIYKKKGDIVNNQTSSEFIIFDKEQALWPFVVKEISEMNTSIP